MKNAHGDGALEAGGRAAGGGLAEARAPRKTKGKRGGGSDFGAQLLEKQKARFTYGLTEGQFARYVSEAMEHGQDSVVGLMRKLESRLDNVVYRLRVVKTRP